MKPKISVIMPVYNSEAFVSRAIRSVLNQTYKDFELLAIDDGSTDRSLSIIQKFRDKRLKLIRHYKNRGLVESLNEGIGVAQGEYLARMDADDISLSRRFEVQTRILDRNPEIGVLGTSVYRLSVKKVITWIYDWENERSKSRLLFEPALAHPTVFIRKDIIDRFKLRYNKNDKHAEDYGLWTKLSDIAHMKSTTEPLFIYREHKGQKSNNDKIDAIRNFRSGFLLKMGIKPTLVESQIHNKICESTQKINNDDLVKIKNWLMKLTEFNKEREIFKTSSFEDILGEKWIYSSLRAESLTYEEKLKIIPEFPIFINSLDYIAKKLLLKKYYDFFSNIHHSVLE